MSRCLRGQLPHWFGEDFARAAVMVGMDAGHAYLHDPAVLVYPLRVSIGDFDLAWLGRDEQYAVLLPAWVDDGTQLPDFQRS